MTWTTRKLKLGPPLTSFAHDDVCLGLVGKNSTWWPLRLQLTSTEEDALDTIGDVDPSSSVDVIFFGDAKTGRLARNKLRPFSDLEEIPSRFVPKRCACRLRMLRYVTRAHVCLPHFAAWHTKGPSRRRTSGPRPPSLQTSLCMISIQSPRCHDSSSWASRELLLPPSF